MSLDKNLIDAFTSSKNENFETPQAFFNKLNAEYDFRLDLAANANNAKVKSFISDLFDPAAFDILNFAPTLLRKGDAVFLNPPYGKRIKNFIQRSIEIADKYSVTLVMLLPARTDTKWFNLIWDRALKRPKPFFEVEFIEGRLVFELDGKPIVNPKTGKKSGALFPSMVIVYKPY